MPRLPRPARLGLLTGAVIWAMVVAAPPAVLADTARLEPVTQPTPGELPRNVDHRVVVIDQRGSRRTFGPVPNGRLFADPGGRHLLVVPPESDESVSPWLVPLDGSPPRPLRLPAGTAIDDDLSPISWTPDGTELAIGDVVGWDPSVVPTLAEIRDPGLFRWTALRCSVVTGECLELPAPGGLAVGVPGGILTTSSVFSTLPSSWLLGELDNRKRPAWERPTSPRGRTWIAIAGDRRVTTTQLVGPPVTTLGRADRSGAQGLPIALSAVGGPAGAVISRVTFVSTVEHRRGRVRLRTRVRSPRFLLATPGAPLRAFASRPVVLPHRDRRRIDEATAFRRQRLHFHPWFGTADGWVGGAGAGAAGAGGAAVLATMDRDGTVRPVTVRGRPATAWALLRAAHGRSPGRVTDPIEIVGYEAAGNLIVRIFYQPPSLDSTGGGATLRVPLQGSARPTVIRSRVDAAW